MKTFEINKDFHFGAKDFPARETAIDSQEFKVNRISSKSRTNGFLGPEGTVTGEVAQHVFAGADTKQPLSHRTVGSWKIEFILP